LHWSPRTAKQRLEEAIALNQRLPLLIDAMRAGRIDLSKATAVLDETAHLTVADAVRVAQEILKTAEVKTTSEVRSQARRLALQIKPKESKKAARKRVHDARGVRAWDNGDGTAGLFITLTSAEIATVWAVLNSAAHQAKQADPSPKDRTTQTTLADVFMDIYPRLLQPAHPRHQHRGRGRGRGRRRHDRS